MVIRILIWLFASYSYDFSDRSDVVSLERQ